MFPFVYHYFFSLLFIYSFVNYVFFFSLWPLFLTLPCTCLLITCSLTMGPCPPRYHSVWFHHRCGQSIQYKSFSISWLIFLHQTNYTSFTLITGFQIHTGICCSLTAPKSLKEVFYIVTTGSYSYSLLQLFYKYFFFF